jgi:hypothetical protein
LPERFVVPVVLVPAVIPPLSPISASWFSTMLRMPAVPSGSFFADGFLETSTRDTVLAGSCARKLPSCSPSSGEERPLICTTTFWFPRRLTLFVPSTSTDGTLGSTSIDVGLHERREAERANAHRIASGGEPFDAEGAIGFRESTAGERRVRARLAHGDGAAGDRTVGAGLHEAATDLAGGVRRAWCGGALCGECGSEGESECSYAKQRCSAIHRSINEPSRQRDRAGGSMVTSCVAES